MLVIWGKNILFFSSNPCWYCDFSGKEEEITRHGKTGGLSRVNQVVDKRVTGQKRVILSGLKTGYGQIGLGRVNKYFSHEFLFFIFIKKTTCICHLESYAINYLM